MTARLDPTLTPLSPGACRPSSIPDARSIASDPNLRYVDLNRAINATYNQMAGLFQEIIGSQESRPSWYAIAPYASRVAGRSMMSAAEALAAVGDAVQRGLTPEQESDVRNCLNGVLDPSSELSFEQMDQIRTLAVSPWFKLAIVFLTAFDGGDLNWDPRTLFVCAARLVDLVSAAPGDSTLRRFEHVVSTIRDALEDGNRRIFTDIAIAGQSYLEWRAALGHVPTPQEVLTTPESQRIYQAAQAAIHRNEVPTQFDTSGPELMTAAFALYEAAGQTPRGDLQDRMVATANNLLAYREQFEVVQPAFEPPPRPAVFAILTPTVKLPLHDGTWRYAEYAGRALPARDWNPLTPRITEYNWATFADRWCGILDSFDTAYRDNAAMWPMPDPDPAHSM